MILIDWLVARKIPLKSPPTVFYGEYGSYPRMYFDTPKEANDYVNKCMAEEAEAKKKELETKRIKYPENIDKPRQHDFKKIEHDMRKIEIEKARAEQQQKNRNDLIDIYTPLYKKTVAASRITQNSYPAKYDWGKTLAILDEQRFRNVEKGDECYVALVTDTGFEHCTGWQRWIVKDSRYDSPSFTFDIPGGTTIVGMLVYKDSQIIMTGRLTAQRFHNDGTYQVTLTYKRGG